MALPFHTLIDIGDPELAAYAVETALSLETSGKMLVVEAHPALQRLPPKHKFSLAVFDLRSRTREEVWQLCQPDSESGLPIASILVGPPGDADFRSRMISMSDDFFRESFLQFLAFCYITQQVRAVLSDARKLL